MFLSLFLLLGLLPGALNGVPVREIGRGVPGKEVSAEGRPSGGTISEPVAALKGLTLSEVCHLTLAEYCEREIAARSAEIFGEIMDEKHRRRDC